jgi:DNA end-binding protein Ku
MAAVRKGIVTFGLVSIPVELHVAARSQSLDFDLLHRSCKTPIKYRLYCPTHDAEVSRKEVVKGYKVNGGYVVVEPEDFEKAERATSRAIEVVQFVDESTVDPVYLERSYWVGPQPDMERPYQVLLDALRESGKAAIVTFVMSNRQQYALLRADGDRLALHTLYYGDEVRELDADWKHPKPSPQEVKFAGQLIDALTKKFEPSAFHDEYRERLEEIIRAKASGKELELPEAPKPKGKVVDLMEALRQSVAQVRKPPAKAARARSRPRRTRRAA